MYHTCAFCNGKLDGDGGPSGLGVGRRLAFDEWRGRLWVICSRCARWNLTPLDDRLERIEGVARVARDGRVLASTDQISLIRWQTYDLVQVGKPPRVELATWRYGERLRQRSKEKAKIVVPLTIAAVGLGIAANVAAGGGLGVIVWNMHSIGEWGYVTIVGNRKVQFLEPPICAHCGSVMQLRAKHVQHARLIQERSADLAVLLSCPACRELTLRSLRPERRLALEMAVDEQAEVQELERQWREAEEIAEIADGTLSSTPELEAHLRRLKDEQNPPRH